MGNWRPGRLGCSEAVRPRSRQPSLAQEGSARAGGKGYCPRAALEEDRRRPLDAILPLEWIGGGRPAVRSARPRVARTTRGVVSPASAARAQQGRFLARGESRDMGSVGSRLRMGVRNGFGRRWLYRAGARAHVGGPAPSGHPVLAARRVLPCPAAHARHGRGFGPCVASCCVAHTSGSWMVYPPRRSAGCPRRDLLPPHRQSGTSHASGGEGDPMRRVRLSRRKDEGPGTGLRPTHPRLFVERAGCGPPPPLLSTLASLSPRSIAFCKSFTSASRKDSGGVRILALWGGEPMRRARLPSKRLAAARWPHPEDAPRRRLEA